MKSLLHSRLLFRGRAAGILTGTLIIALHQSAGGRAQEVKHLEFEVASVKPALKPYLQTTPSRHGGRIEWTTDLWYMIGYAYRLQPYRISGPIPGSSNVYAVEATFDPAAGDNDVRLMFQTLLKDRFKMTSHAVTKDLQGYALSVADGGLKITQVRASDEPTPLPGWVQRGTSSLDDFEGKIFSVGLSPGIIAVTARRVTLRQFCDELERLLGIPVLDRTGLTGSFYFAFRYAQPDAPPEVALPALFTAIQEELGLKLTRYQGPVEILIVDHIDKVPTAN